MTLYNVDEINKLSFFTVISCPLNIFFTQGKHSGTFVCQPASGSGDMSSNPGKGDNLI